MKKEIDVALDLLIAYISHFGSIKEENIEEFRTCLQKNLLERYQGHWYPDKPIKGQAYRSLEFTKQNEYCDVIVSQICRELGFSPSLLGLRHDMTLWIDPYEVTIRIGNHASPKENQQLLVARFDKEGNELVKNDLDTLFSQSRLSMVTTNTLRSSPTNSSSCDSTSCSGTSTPQRTSSPFPLGQPSLVVPLPPTMYHNGPLFTPPRALSPQAPAFQMSPSAPIRVPVKHEQNLSLQNHAESMSSEGSPIDANHLQPDRSDTPHSMHSTTSNESSDSGYCGYVESFPYYYKLNRLYKALAIQKLSNKGTPIVKTTNNSPVTQHHRRRVPQQQQHYQPFQQQQHQNIPIIPSSTSTLSSSPPTPTPMNINQFTPFYSQQSSFLPMPTTVTDSRKSKY